MIAIIDYGMGNLRSVWKAFESVGHQALVTRDPAAITNAGHVVTPGVGAFGDCMANLERFDLVEPIRSAVQSGKPFLGICWGFNCCLRKVRKFGAHKGLNIIPGQVKRFVPDPALKIPHMGWNQVNVERPCPLFADIVSGSDWYFVHSYFPSELIQMVRHRDNHLRHSIRLGRMEGQYRGLSVPSGKSQSVGLRLIEKF